MLRKSRRIGRNLPCVHSFTRTLNFQPLETRRLLAGAGEPTLPDPTTASITADDVGRLQPGQLVTFESSNSATIPTETAFRMRSSQGEWFSARGYAEESQWIWDTTGLPADTYYVGTFVRAQGSAAAYQAAATPLTFTLSNEEVTEATISTDAAFATVGSEVEFFGFGKGTTPDLEYAFVGRSAQDDWRILRDYETNPNWNWDTAAYAAGTYYIGLYVRAPGSPAAYDVAATPVQVDLANAAPMDRLELSSDLSMEPATGELVTFSAEAIGEVQSADYEYSFWRRADDTDWEIVRPYAAETEWQWDTSIAESGVYYVGAVARRIGSNARYEWAATPLTIIVDVPAIAGTGFGQLYSTILVATCDSSAAAKTEAHFVGDCSGDQEEINAAIQALPDAGGVITLAEGTYDIRAVEGTLGGITIDRSNVIFQGSGTATRLLLADNQNTNVIRITGDGISNVSVQDLYINGNFENNYSPIFEANGVKAESSTDNPLRSITVQNTHIEDSARLNIFLKAVDARILDNVIGDSRSDSVEILLGPGIISGNYAEIDDVTGYVISTDQADDVTITDNIIHILPEGSISQSVIRTWGGRYSHIISENQVRAEGPVNRMLEVNSYISVIDSNIFLNFNDRTTAEINAAALVHSNVFHNTDVVMKPTADWSSSVVDNILFAGSEIRNEPAAGVNAELFEDNNISVG